MEKKITLSLRRCLLLAGTLALVSSCQDYEPFSDQQIQDVAYTHEFERKFGKIDPNQNWDLFGQLAGGYRGAVTRATDPSSVIVTFMDPLIVPYEDMVEYQRVLPEDGGQRRKDAGYQAYDCPYSFTNLGRVTQDFVTTAREFTIEQVNFITSGVDVIGIYWYCEANEPGALRVVGRDGNTYWVQRKQIYENKTGMKGYRTIYEWVDLNPEQSGGYYDELFDEFPDRYVLYDGSQRVELVDEETLAIGDKIFYTETQDEQTGEEIWRKCSRWYWGGTVYIPDIIRRDLIVLHPDFVTADGSNAYIGYDNQPFNAGEFLKPAYTREVYKSNTDDASSFYPEASYVRSTPINVQVPTSIPYYGFYITNSNGAGWDSQGGTRFSEANLNDQVEFRSDPGSDISGWQNSHYVATFDIHDIDPDMESKQYLCFEDWMGGAKNFDLNDLVFKINLDPTTLIDHESTNEWALLVCEDLKSFDFDFNDVVLQLHYEEGLERTYHLDIDGNVTSVDVVKDVPQLNITAMAAGGAYSSQIYINYHEGDSPWGEIHALLGETGSHGDHDHSIINAGETIGSLGQTITVPANQLPEPNLIGENNENGYPTYLSQLFDTDGFFRIVCDEGREAQKIIKNGSYAYSEGVAPQMMLLPAYFEWPQELVYIFDAYEGFSEWVQDAAKTQWIMATQIEKNITDRGVLWNSSSIGIEAGKMPMIVFHEQEFTYTDKYGVVTTYPHSAKVDFTTSFPEDWTPSSEDYGLLTVVFSSKPGPTTYVDFADGAQIIEDKSSKTVMSYHLSKSEYAKAFQTGAIYFMCSNPDNAVVIETAELVTYRTSDSN